MPDQESQDLNRSLDELKYEFQDKPQGYSTEVIIGDNRFSDVLPPRVEIVLLDPEEDKLAFRRVSDPLLNDQNGDWNIGELEEVIEETLSWKAELEEMEEEQNSIEETFQE